MNDGVRHKEGEVIIGGDLIAHHQSWSSSRTDSRVIALADIAMRSDSQILNDEQPKLIRPGLQ